MYFKKLELFGFKSFADKTTLNFEPGITAIVGPNGCGKSNIFDSIRWVLGEQSMKELRGSSREDVIFNGTEKKASLGFAEVSLTFSNESRMLPVDMDEVIITRRQYRSGESEYLLNKEITRLKTIHEILMGTGIGAEAYSMVQQGRVDLVVSAKPEDRRIILDEAAGITKYKAKKKEALSKLKDTEDNLLRVNDIVTEVKRQIASIERQANKARKYKEEFEKLKGLEVRIARYQVEAYEQQKRNLAQTLAELQSKQQKFSQEIEELNNQLTNEINYLDEIEQKINEVQSEEIKLQGQIDLNTRQSAFNIERIETLTQTNQRLAQQKDQLIERCRLQQIKIEELKQSLISLQQTTQSNEQVLKDKRELLATIEKSIHEARIKIKDHEEKILNLTSQQVSIRNDLTDSMKEVQGAIARKRRLELENEKVSVEKQEIDQKLHTSEVQLRSVQSTMEELSQAKDIKQKELDQLKTLLDQLRNTINELEKKKLFFISQKEFIEKLNVQYQDIPDPVIEGRFITQAPPQEHHTGIIGKVKMVQPFEGERLEWVKNNLGAAQAERLYEIVCETKFIELDPQQISLKIEEINAEIERVSIEHQGVVVKVQELDNALQQLNQEIHGKEKTFSILEAQKKDIIDEMQKLTGELELVDGELFEVKEILNNLKKKEDELNYRLDTVTQDLGWCQNDIKERQNWITSRSQEKEEQTIAVTQLSAEIESIKDKLNVQQENINVFTQTLDEWLEEIKKIDDETSQNLIKKEQLVADNEKIITVIDELQVQKDSIKGTIHEFEIQKEDIGQRINSARANINALGDELEGVKGEFHIQQMKEQELAFNAKSIKDRLLQSYKIDFDVVLAKKNETPQVEAASCEVVPSLATDQPLLEGEVSQEAAAANPAPVVAVHEPELPGIWEEITNWDETNIELEKLRKRCEAYGSVNLVAIEEYEELKQRFEFLTKQQSDLIEAKSQLMNTINKINRSTRQMFMDTFTKVSEEFRIYFRMLFGGGEAQLVLMDPENVLESGIEIIARPPGKKLQSISLMSGGEKTLTAIALIFGVFKVNPSPFCILDEIDAALDEANVGRFSYLLQDFAKIAQFIVITHNKKTISSANVMYGITMPETGISRIVSVKFHDEKQKEKTTEEVPVAA